MALPLEGHPARAEGAPDRPVVDPSSLLVDLVPEGDDVLTASAITRDHLLVVRTRAGVSSLPTHAPDGAHLAEVSALTGGLAAVTGVAAHPSARGVVAVGRTSFTAPNTVTAWRPDRPGRADAAPGPALPAATVSQVRDASPDGTAIPGRHGRRGGRGVAPGRDAGQQAPGVRRLRGGR